jgi:hypothetical protein
LATADNTRLAFPPIGKSAGFIFKFLKKPADFANPKRYPKFGSAAKEGDKMCLRYRMIK